MWRVARKFYLKSPTPPGAAHEERVEEQQGRRCGEAKPNRGAPQWYQMRCIKRERNDTDEIRRLFTVFRQLFCNILLARTRRALSPSLTPQKGPVPGGIGSQKIPFC